MALAPPPAGLVRMTNAALGGIEAPSYVSIDAYRGSFYAAGWRSVDDPLFTGTNTGAPNPIPDSIEDFAYIPAIARWRQKLAVARSGGLSVQLTVIGDSMSEGFTASRYRNRWLDILRRRIQGAKPGSMGYLPASANLASGVTDGDWAGGDNPWTFTGTTGSGNFGPGFHAASITSGSATITYFGDVINLFYARTVTGPSAASVTLDGVAQTNLNANGSLLPGQIASYGTVGAYGFHTLVVTVSSGTLVLEGAWWFDSDFNGLASVGSLVTIDSSHAGFSADFWSGANNDWSAMFAGTEPYSGLVLVCLGRNDVANGRIPQQFEDDLVTIASRYDTRTAASDIGYLFCFLPSDNNVTPMVNAAWRASNRIGLTRAGVVDLGQMRPGRTWGADLEDDGVHPNNAGHEWVAETLASILDPSPPTAPLTTPDRQVIDRDTPVTFRSSWAESLGGTGFGTYDSSPGAASISERRYRRWLDAGTYRVTLFTDNFASGNTAAEALLGRYVGNTPTLTSCGTVNTSSGTGTTRTRLGTSIVNDVPCWAPLVVRQPAVAAAVRFVEAVIEKTA